MIEPLGIGCLGLFLGYLCWYFVVRIPIGKASIETFASVVAVLTGGLVIKFLDAHLERPVDVWLYPIGLVAGMALYIGLSFATGKGKQVTLLPTGEVYPNALGQFE